MVKDLASYWGLPSSYQLIVKFIKLGTIDRSQILKTDISLNQQLLASKLINELEAKVDLFYVSLPLVYSKIEDKNLFYVQDNMNLDNSKLDTKPQDTRGDNLGIEDIQGENDATNEIDDDDNEDEIEVDDLEEDENSTVRSIGANKTGIKNTSQRPYINDDRVTIGQVFQQNGTNSTTPMTHASFNSINAMSKLNYYKNFGLSGFRFLPNNKLSFAERDLVLNTNNFIDIHIDDELKPKVEEKRKSFPNRLGNRKSTIYKLTQTLLI